MYELYRGVWKFFWKLDSQKRHILHSLDRMQLIRMCSLLSFSQSLVPLWSPNRRTKKSIYLFKFLLLLSINVTYKTYESFTYWKKKSSHRVKKKRFPLYMYKKHLGKVKPQIVSQRSLYCEWERAGKPKIIFFFCKVSLLFTLTIYPRLCFEIPSKTGVEIYIEWMARYKHIHWQSCRCLLNISFTLRPVVQSRPNS